ncbi:MAG: type II toxin-antitoxin system RelE/ParE family toxin [Thermoplasmata archaeon]
MGPRDGARADQETVGPLTPWSIKWSDTAVRDLHRLDRTAARGVVTRLEASALDPTHYFTRLTTSDEYKLRIGDYRLLAVLSLSEQTILVERVDHRSRIYDR